MGKARHGNDRRIPPGSASPGPSTGQAGQKESLGEGADVLIVGAGAAGCTAATLLARARRRVVLLDRAALDDRPLAPAWVGPGVEDVLKKMGLSIRDLPAEPIRTVAFLTSDFEKCQEVQPARGTGFFVERGGWNTVLLKAAIGAGARYLERHAVLRLRMREEHVTAECDGGRRATASLVAVADGAFSETAAAIGLDLVPNAGGRFAACVVWLPSRQGVLSEGVLHFVLSSEPAAGLASFWCVGDQAVVTALDRTEAATRNLLVRTLARVCDRLGVAPPRDFAPGGVPVRRIPAGQALDIETHVGKRAVVFGEAGGFVAAATGEGIYPAMWSAQVAAEVIRDALDEPHPQDGLRRFDTQWRTAMADYLRPPNTDLQFLLPLVFSNRQMAERLANAFLQGENL